MNIECERSIWLMNSREVSKAELTFTRLDTPRHLAKEAFQQIIFHPDFKAPPLEDGEVLLVSVEVKLIPRVKI